jgi:hypothetical protein
MASMDSRSLLAAAMALAAAVIFLSTTTPLACAASVEHTFVVSSRTNPELDRTFIKSAHNSSLVLDFF